jgi:hypothetical protein
MNEYLDPSELRAGDVLLMKGVGPVSDLVAWFGDSIYSHAAILVDSSTLVEAALPTSRKVPLATRLAEGDHYDFLDVYRPTRSDGTPLQAPDLEALGKAAESLLGLGYPLDGLLQLAVVAAVRNKLPTDWRIRFLLRVLVDFLIEDNPHEAVCSELVYRSFLVASEKTPAPVTPCLIPTGTLDLPFPKIDWMELLKEWEEAQKRRPQLPALPESLWASLTAAAPAFEIETLEDQLQELRRRRSGTAEVELERKKAPEAVAGIPVISQPNPRDVLPVDLETSPNLRRLGRLRLTKPSP